jgi:uncharacterized protein YjbJ (UPF0337 family)
MSQLKRDLDHAKNKLAGGAKEAAGKVTGNEQLELKGKIQSSKADLKKNTSVANKIENVKEKIAGSINNSIDKNKRMTRNGSKH